MVAHKTIYKVRQSPWNTWIVYQFDGTRHPARMYETDNEVKAQGVMEYLTKMEALSERIRRD
jgi:hypothetical protein